MIRRQMPSSPTTEAEQKKHINFLSILSKIRPIFWQNKIAPAFWTVGSIFSLVLNIILIVVLIMVGRQLFAIKGLVEDGLINGLYNNFVMMDDASIITTIQVEETIQVVDSIPVVFDLALDQETVVTLVQDTYIPNTTVDLNGMKVPTTVMLPVGTPLNISLDLIVPVSQTIPVVLNVPISLQVPVNIPLSQTELHKPFVGLQNVVKPYRSYLGALPNSWQETPVCGDIPGQVCPWVLDIK